MKDFINTIRKKWYLEDYGIIILWALIISALIFLFQFGLIKVIDALGDIIVALIGAGALLMGGILTHALTQHREQSLRQAETMQKHYLDLLSQIDDLVRNSGFGDQFTKTHLKTWVFGSPQVIERTQAIAECKSGETMIEAIEKLVLAMRSDLGLPKPYKIKLKYVFPKKYKRYAHDEEDNN